MTAFWCDACELEWADGVDYQACPKCGAELLVLDVAPARPVEFPSVRAMARAVFVVLVALQAVFAVAAPHDFAYLRTILVLAQLASAIAVIVAVMAFRPVRALVTERVRILHGLEHATIAVLGERGATVRSGVTYDDQFELELASESGGARTAVADVESAARDAIARVHAGERALVYCLACGTSLVVGWLLVAVAIAGVGAVALAMHVPHGYAFALSVAFVEVARRMRDRIGLAAQRALTVSASFASARVCNVSREVAASGRYVTYWVRVDVEPVASVIAEPA